MMLAAGPGTEIHMIATGPDAAAALEALKDLVEAGFRRGIGGGSLRASPLFLPPGPVYRLMRSVESCRAICRNAPRNSLPVLAE